VTGALCLLAGVLAGLATARTPTPLWMFAAAALVMTVALPPVRHAAICRRLAAFTLGLLLASLEIARWSALVIVPGSSDSRALVEARVLEPPARQGVELRFDAEIRGLAGPADARLRRARLTWRDAATAPRAGERWRLIVRLAPLADTHNFTGPSPARGALRDRIHVAGRVLPGALNERLALAPDSIATTRARIASRIGDAVADPDAAALLAALAVGLTDGVSADQWRVFNATGTTHLVAISGLHVTLFALVAFAIARGFWRVLPPARRMQRETFALLAGLVAAGGYALLAGFSVPTQRTWLMLAIFAGARLTARATGSARTWALALIAVLLVDPLAPLAAGFWLSFVAVGVLLLLDHAALARNAPSFAGRMRQALRLQLAVMLLLAPFTVAVFGGISLAGLAVNLVAIPVVSFVFVPLVLAGALVSLPVPTLGAALFRGAAALYDLAWPALVAAADPAYALWRVAPPAWWFAVAFIAAGLLLLRWPAALRLTGIAAALPLLFAPPRAPPAGSARIEVLDAGRGASVLVITHSHVVLFDTGDSWGSGGSRARHVVLSALVPLGRGVDELLLPALDPDRAAGAALLAHEGTVDSIRVGGGWPGTRLPAQRCAELAFDFDGVRFEVLTGGPDARYCALRVVARGRALLMGGDLDAAAERALAARLGARHLASDAVIMSRHASSLGSARQWIEASGAGLVIATGGIASESRRVAVARWRATGARILDTRTDGAIIVELGTNGLEILGIARRSRYPFAWRRLP
jgi:competence protein ComEC